MTQQPAQQQIQVVFPDAVKGGVYSNFMEVKHTKEEFVLDFMMVIPPAGAVTARVVVSPGHMKRMVAALTQNLDLYEKKFGKLTPAEEPPRPMGFQVLGK